MPLQTPQDIITFALRATGVLGVGQSALPEDYQDAFSALNSMLALWNRERWLVYHLLDLSVTTTGQQFYTLGPGQDFNTPRIDRIEAAYFRQITNNTQGQNFVDFPLSLFDSMEDYSKVELKKLTSWPTSLFYDSGFPIGRVFPVPIPNVFPSELHILVKETLPTFTSYTQTVNLPPEYFETIWTNLTIRLATIYPGVLLTDDLRGLAKSSLQTIRGANAQISELSMPAGLYRGVLYNIYSDQVY